MGAGKPGWVVQNLKQIADEFLPPLKMVLAFLACGALVGVIVLVGFCRRRSESQHAPGEIVTANLVSLDHGGNVLIVGESVTHTGRAKSGTATTRHTGRLDVIDLADGHRRARVVFDRPQACVSAGPGIAWCDSGDDNALEVRDAATLAVHVSSSKVRAKAPPLSNAKPEIDRHTGVAWFTTTDNRFWHVDPRTLAAGIETDHPSRETTQSIGQHFDTRLERFEVPEGWYDFEGKPRAVLSFHDTQHRDPNNGDVPVKPIAPETTLIAPSFVASFEQDPGHAMIVGAARWLIVAHDDNVDHASASLLVTAMTVDGKQHWTTTFAGGELVGAWIVDNHLVLAIGAREQQGAVVALDVADGHVLWRTGT
ncbi:MAG: hypothetical protein JWO36_1707 [Myxococcales bacterium]|nr:hypothetical protein [Myxococcales bacterium]